jgi:hypothetical protein
MSRRSWPIPGLQSLFVASLLATAPQIALAGSGHFTPHPTTPVFGTVGSRAIAMGDIDGDGDLDIIAARNGGETVWRNDGTGSFSPHPTPSFGAGNTNSIALGDVDSDGVPDAVVGNGTGEAETVWRNSLGVLSAHPTAPSFGAGSTTFVALRDLDGDGDLDAIAVNTAGQATTVWLNNGAGVFTSHPVTPSFGAGGTKMYAALGDLDGDGDIDVVLVDSAASQTIWLNDGTGSFSLRPTDATFGPTGAFAIALGDIDGDGDLDAVVPTFGAERVYLNDGTGLFTAHPTTPLFGTGTSVSLALGDIDGDGDLDAIVGNLLEPNTTWLNDGAGNFSPHPTRPSFGTQARLVVLGDIDGDGDLDMVLADGGGGEAVWLNLSAFAIATAVTPVGAGSVTCTDNPVLQGGSSTCTYTANAGFTFDSWSGDCIGATCTLTNVTSAKSVTANFTAPTYAIATAVNPVGSGTVTCTPNPVTHGTGSTCTATANPGFGFTAWSGDCIGATCTLTNVTSAGNVTANFTAVTYAITTAVSPAGSGTVTCTPNPVGHAGSSTCTATANAGFGFTAWSGDCIGATCTLTNVTSARNVTASFSATTYAITTAVNPAGSGTVSCTPSPVGHAGSSTCTATANAGFTFTAWSGDCAGATCTLANVTSAKSVTASFSAITYAITSAVNPAGAGTVTCTPNPVGHAGSSMCTAAANAGFGFTAWSGDCVGATCTLTSVTSAKSVTANYTTLNRTFSGPSATTSGTISASFTATDASCTYGTTQFIAPPPGSPPVPPTAPVSVVFPHGLFDFTITACAPGATVNLTITYPAPLPPGTLYWKYGPEPGNTVPHWYVMPSTIAGNTATFSITDGGQGDDDLTANGTIVDQGGPGIPPGGSPAQTPTLSQWALILLASLMLVAGWAGYPAGKTRRPSGQRERARG